jgi:hypothetical protein
MAGEHRKLSVSVINITVTIFLYPKNKKKQKKRFQIPKSEGGWYGGFPSLMLAR